jgi:hypothetical protein
MDNRETLREQGLIDDSVEPLPDPYYEVIDTMTSEEVNALVSLKQRLNRAGISTVPITADWVEDSEQIGIL